MQTAILSSTSTNPLEAYLKRLIERHGPVTVAEYMALALGHPDYGYYQTRDPFGRGGDFTTAPEISQMFGELIGAWGIAQWQALGSPKVNLVEFGPGRGTLMRDALRIAGKIAPGFVAAASVHLVETSPVLREAQTKLLGEYNPIWHDGIEDVPEGPSIYVMNEFLDALPVRQFVVTETGLCERRVGVIDGKFAFVVEREPRVPSATLTTDLPIGSIVETCPAALAITREIATRIAICGGAAVIADYGYDVPAGEDTFQAVRNHEYANVLENPGENDLTAHVDFSAIAQAARDAGVVVTGPIGQGAFLTSLGIQTRAQTLIEAGNKNAAAALHRLTADDQMGLLFKVVQLKRKEEII
jgi:NADH dehydrogenase [ubiquinone] 1 alpha subcomplex assembly factor 7